MLELSRWKIILVAGSLIFGLLFSLPNVLPDSVLAHWPGFLPHQRLNLGLDLQGGSSLLYEVDTDALKKERLNDLTEEAQPGAARGADHLLRTSARQTGVVAPEGHRPGPDRRRGDRAGQGGRLDDDRRARRHRHPRRGRQFPDRRLTPAASRSRMTRNAVAQSIEIIRRRIDLLGTKEPDIRQQGARPDRHRGARRERPGEAEGRHRPDRQADLPDGRRAGRSRRTRQPVVPPDDVVLPYTETIGGGARASSWSSAASRSTASMLTHAQQGFDPQNGTPVVEFRLNGAGAHRFGQVTTENVGNAFAIVLDNQVISAPRDREPDHRRPGPDHRQLHRSRAPTSWRCC